MKIEIKISDLRIRELPTTQSPAHGFISSGIHEYSEYVDKPDYRWYHLKEGWVAGIEGSVIQLRWDAPAPVERDESLNQVYVGDVSLRIRANHSTSFAHQDMCKKNVYYNVLEVSKQSDYVWYKIGDEAWIAEVEEVEYCPAGSRPKREILNMISQLQASLNIAKNCVDKGLDSDKYDELYDDMLELNAFIQNNFDPMDYDIIDNNNYDTIALLYTTDVHGYWKGYADSARATTNFSYNISSSAYDNLKAYKKKLEDKGYKVLCVDCGDSTHGSAKINECGGIDAINAMNDIGYFASTIGNHEFKGGYSVDIIPKVLNKCKSLCACNLFYKGTNKTVYPPYRTAKIGNKRIGVIGVAFPGFDGDKDAWKEQYDILDTDKLYVVVQKHIDELKQAGFDYICMVAHIGTNGDGAREVAGTHDIVEHTSGLNIVFRGHSHADDESYIITDKKSNKVLFPAQPRCDFQYITEVKLTKEGISVKKFTDLY